LKEPPKEYGCIGKKGGGGHDFQSRNGIKGNRGSSDTKSLSFETHKRANKRTSQKQTAKKKPELRYLNACDRGKKSGRCEVTTKTKTQGPGYKLGRGGRHWTSKKRKWRTDLQGGI